MSALNILCRVGFATYPYRTYTCTVLRVPIHKLLQSVATVKRQRKFTCCTTLINDLLTLYAYIYNTIYIYINKTFFYKSIHSNEYNVNTYARTPSSVLSVDSPFPSLFVDLSYSSV